MSATFHFTTITPIQATVIKLVMIVVEFKKLGLSAKLHARHEAKRKRQA